MEQVNRMFREALEGEDQSDMDDFYSELNARALRNFLDRHSLTDAMYCIMDQIGECCHMPESQLMERCVRLSDDSVVSKGKWKIAESDVHNGFQELLLADYVQRVSKDALLLMEGKIREDSSIPGPIAGLPELCDIDFTEEGAALYLRSQEEVFHMGDKEVVQGKAVFSGVLHADDTSFSVISTTSEMVAVDFYNYLTGLEFPITIAMISDAKPIGPWRMRWWHVLPVGWRIDVQYE